MVAGGVRVQCGWAGQGGAGVVALHRVLVSAGECWQLACWTAGVDVT